MQAKYLDIKIYKCLRLALLISVPFLTTAVRGEESGDSANYEMQGCRAWVRGTINPNLVPQDLMIRAGVCFGKVVGVWSTALRFGVTCSPDRVTANQAVRVIVQYIDTRPSRMHEDFTSLTLEALKAAWPCR